MKRILLFTLIIIFTGYSQNPIQPNHPSFNDDLQPSMYIYNVKDGSELKQSGKVLIE